MAEAKTYSGSCHCGKVRYEVTTDLEKVITCNCSICSRTGWMLNFVSEPQFKLLAGDDVLSDYLFHKKHIHHVFCRECGIRSFSRADLGGKKMFAINVRCLDGVDLKALKVTEVDGKSL